MRGRSPGFRAEACGFRRVAFPRLAAQWLKWTRLDSITVAGAASVLHRTSRLPEGQPTREHLARKACLRGRVPVKLRVQCARRRGKLGAVTASSTKRDSLGAAAELAAYAGILPLVACLIALVFLPSDSLHVLAQEIALAYGAVVLALLGGVHWGLALAGRLRWSPQRVAACLLPAACGAASVVLGGQRGLALLVVASGLFWLYEHRRVGDELPEDYLRLRRNLTLAGCCLLALIMIVSDSVGLP
jgi:hypothetical protein